MKLTPRPHRLPLTILAATMAIITGMPVHAADSAPEFSVLARFTGSAGELPGIRPFAAPIWSEQDALLLGTTRSGGPGFGFEYTPGLFQYTRGVIYQYALDGSISTATLGEDIGWGATPPVRRQDGSIVSTSMYSVNADGENVGSLFSLNGGKATRLADAPRARGQTGTSPTGDLYTTGGLGTSCRDGAGAPLSRIALDGTVTTITDFCGFTTTDSSRRLIFHKGAAPVINLWSTSDNALYGMSYIGSNAAHDGVPAGDLAGGAIVRIHGEALTAGQVTEEDIEVLHYFRRNAEGSVTAGDILATSMLEDGDWLYGTLTGGDNALGAVWRMKKDDPDSFRLVQRFEVDLGAAASHADGTPTNPSGQLVRGADGNIYGTSRRDASAIQPTGSAGKFSAVGSGTLWRIRTGSAADRSDDAFEVLHRFNSQDGSVPVGLTAGPVVGGKQLIFGATESGGSPGDSCYISNGSTISTDCSGNGTLFQLAIPLPPVTIGTFTADGDTALSVANGSRPVLAWQSSGAASCEASGNWNGARLASGSEQIGPLASGTYQYTLICASAAGVQSAPATLSVTVQDATGETEPGNSSGGGGPLTPAALLLASLALLGRRRQA